MLVLQTLEEAEEAISRAPGQFRSELTLEKKVTRPIRGLSTEGLDANNQGDITALEQVMSDKGKQLSIEPEPIKPVAAVTISPLPSTAPPILTVIVEKVEKSKNKPPKDIEVVVLHDLNFALKVLKDGQEENLMSLITQTWAEIRENPQAIFRQEMTVLGHT
ncbi:hypothetical protein Droror1_Dr00023471 [Drosera rotundifolia]